MYMLLYVILWIWMVFYAIEDYWSILPIAVVVPLFHKKVYMHNVINLYNLVLHRL